MESMKNKNQEARDASSANLAKRLAAYSAAAGVALAMAPQVDATIQTFQPSTPVTMDKGIDMDMDGVGDFFFLVDKDYSGYEGRRHLTIVRKHELNRFDDTDGAARRLLKGDPVNAALDGEEALLMDVITYSGMSSEVWSSWGYDGQFNDGALGYIGVKFHGHNDTDYDGWILFEGGADYYPLSGTIHGWAYEDSGGPITAGEEGEIHALQTVSIKVTDICALEPGGNTASFEIVRTGGTNKPLTVYYTIEGTAKNGIDYVKIPEKITIPARKSVRSIIIKPIDDTIKEGQEWVDIILNEGALYMIALPSSGSVTISDSGTRYVWNGDGTITDTTTNLVWQSGKDNDNNFRSWASASAYCTELILGGQGGWRLPRVDELTNVVNYAGGYPLSTFNIYGDSYWTGTVSAKTATGAWKVSGNNGSVGAVEQNEPLLSLCVRGKSPWTLDPSDRLKGNTAHTVKDVRFGYIWQKADDGVMRSWEDAKAYCDTLDLDKYSKWRLPKVEELQTIIDYLGYKPALSTEILSGSPVYYWTSSNYSQEPDQAWFVHFSQGNTSPGKKNSTYLVRCIHDKPVVSLADTLDE